MDQDSSSSRGFLGPLSEVPLNVDLESCPTATLQVSPFLNDKQQEAGSSSSSRQEPQATSEAQDGGQKLQGHQAGLKSSGHDTKCVPVEAVVRTQRDTEGLQACLKHPDISDNAQPASGTHSRGVENTTTGATATSPTTSRSIAKPSLLQSQPAPAAAPYHKDNDIIGKEPKKLSIELSGLQPAKDTTSTSSQSNELTPPRKSLPRTSTLQVQSAKVTNAYLLRPILNSTKKTNLPSSVSNWITRPIVNSAKKTNVPSSISSSIKFPNRSSSAASRKAYQEKKSSKPSSSSGTTAPRYKQATGSSVSSVYFKGSGSYYTPFDPSNRAMDGTTSTGTKIRPSSGRDHLDSSSQLSQPVPGFPDLTFMGPRQETQLAHSESYGYASPLNQPRNKLEDLDPSEHTQETLEDDRASKDSELSDVESVGPRSFTSNSTVSALGRSPELIIADSDDDDDDNDDDGRVIYDAEKNDIGRDDNAHADQPDNNMSATNKSCPHNQHTRNSALDDAPYKICKDQFGNIIKTEGALIPVGYQLFDGGFPWICPVRSCRTLHPSIKALGNHFSHGHKGACYNDNLDGTLTFLGLYTKLLNKQPPIIVSKKAMSLDDSPMLEPSHTMANQYKYRVRFPEETLNEHTPRREAQSKQVVSGQAIIVLQGPPLPKPEKILTMADPDRPYNMWPDATGKLEQLYGGLLPSGWTPYYEYPKRQWICPIRSCQCLMKNRYHFGRHFLTHRGCHLNDNLDGTFTILRSPSQAQLDDKDFTDTPSAVVSRQPLDDEPIQSPKIRIKDPSGTQPIWVSLSSYLASVKRGHAKDVKETTPDPVPTKIRIVQSGPRETIFKPVMEAHSDEELTMATKDRKYSFWWDADRNLKDTRGAMIPEGYELDKTWPGRPWICPIRSCRVVCKNTWSLGSHFTELHSSVSLNDNKDGTFSIVGTHQHGAPRVVSKRLVSLHKDPVVEACLPVLKKGEIEEEERKRSQMGSSMDKATTNKPATDPEELWKYLCSMVDRDLSRPSHPSFEHLMALPRIRDLNIIDKRLGPRPLMCSTLAVGLVIQVTGVERQAKQCTACRRGDGPFYECVSICPELAHEIAESSPPLVTSPSNRWCCMNCVLNKSPQKCSLKGSLLERLEDGSVKENIPQWMISSELPAAMVKPKDVSVDDEADKDVDLYRQDATSFSYRRSGRLRSQAEATPSEPQKRPFASTDMASSTSQAVSNAREEEASSLRGSKRIRATQNTPHQDPTPSAIQESLEVEDWEREAKAIPKQNGSSDNLALSSSYNLSTHQNPSTSSTQIWSSPSFSLHVIKIPSGGSHHLRATSDEPLSSPSSRKQQQQTRMCTVIAGKLRVKVKVGLEGEEGDTGTVFNIGLHGLFKLGNEMECTVDNWGYSEAVLQVVGVKGE